jgi:hypothetical protein
MKTWAETIVTSHCNYQSCGHTISYLKFPPKSGMMLVKNWTVFLRLPQVMCFAFHFIFQWSIFESEYKSKCSYYASTFVAILYSVYTFWKHTLDPPCLPCNYPRILISDLLLRALRWTHPHQENSTSLAEPLHTLSHFTCPKSSIINLFLHFSNANIFLNCMRQIPRAHSRQPFGHWRQKSVS